MVKKKNPKRAGIEGFSAFLTLCTSLLVGCLLYGIGLHSKYYTHISLYLYS